MSPPPHPAIPIVVGVGDIKNRSQKVSDAIEPLQLMLQVISLAIKDTNLSSSASKILQSEIDHVGVVNTWTWNYPDLPGLVAENLGVRPRSKVLSHHGGDSPAKLFDEAARRIARGESKVAVITGGEALASLSACAAAGKLPPPGWTKPDENAQSISVSDVSRFGGNLGTKHSVGLPIHVYPLYENAFRAHRHQSILENNIESASLYAAFAKIAERNEFAWNYGKPAATEHDIGTVSKKNRMICFPYPLLMNAFNNINLAGACILTSTSHARTLQIPESQWIYPLGGAGTSDSPDFWSRPNYHSSPSISQSLDTALFISHLTKEEIDIFDFYSCFPIVPKLACAHLGLDIERGGKGEKPITLLGGLTSFGGAGNNYSMHSLTAMVRALRCRSPERPNPRNGLVLANGGMVTYQYVVCLSSTPPKTPYPTHNPLPDLLSPHDIPEIEESANGEAVVETYTVEFNRDGTPGMGYVVGRLLSLGARGEGKRFLANHGDERTLRELCSVTREPIGRRGVVKCNSGGDGRNLFIFEKEGNL